METSWLLIGKFPNQQSHLTIPRKGMETTYIAFTNKAAQVGRT